MSDEHEPLAGDLLVILNDPETAAPLAIMDGTLISAILFLLRASWRTAIFRAAEASTIFAVATAGLTAHGSHRRRAVVLLLARFEQRGNEGDAVDRRGWPNTGQFGEGGLSALRMPFRWGSDPGCMAADKGTSTHAHEGPLRLPCCDGSRGCRARLRCQVRFPGSAPLARRRRRLGHPLRP